MVIMEDKIQEELEKIYKFKIEVIFRTVKCYDVLIQIYGSEYVIPLLYDSTRTLESNISKLVPKIDKLILERFKRSCKND